MTRIHIFLKDIITMDITMQNVASLLVVRIQQSETTGDFDSDCDCGIV